MIAGLWRKLWGRDTTEEECYRAALTRARELAITKARAGEAPRPADAVLYLLVGCERNEQGFLVVAPFMEAMLRKSLGAADSEKERLDRLREIPTKLGDMADMALRLKMVGTTAELRAMAKQISNYVNGEET